MGGNILDIIILNGRPAAGKSEVIDYLKSVPVNERIERFHIGHFEEIDDFPILWERFEDDDILQKHGRERMFSTEGYEFKDNFLWTFYIEKLNLLYTKKLRDDPYLHNSTTVLIEFARGSEHGGFRAAYDALDKTILERAGILYISVSWEESLRKNRRRFNPDKPDSILEHGLEDEKMERIYKESDWDEVSGEDPEFITARGIRVPYSVFNNMPEITDKPDELGAHLEEVCAKLWTLKSSR